IWSAESSFHQLFQIIIKIVRHLLHQVDTIFATYIMLMHRVVKVIYLLAFFHTSLKVKLGVLPNYHIITTSVYEKDFSLQIVNVMDQLVVFIAFMILLRTVHVALGVPHLVVAPV